MNLDLPIQNFSGATRAFQDTAKAVVPAGAQIMFDGVNAPANWLLCDGAELNRADYPELSRIYTGSTPTTFTIPLNPGYIIKV
jgi:microcystin-dependent protein